MSHRWRASHEPQYATGRGLGRLAAIFLLLAAAAASVAGCGSADSAGTAPVTPPSNLVKAGQLTYCSDMEYPPEISIQYGQPVGYDHDSGVAVANEMGLRAEFVQTPLASIFGALKGKKCDAIINSVTITSEREQAAYMIPYGQYGYTIMVLKGNPKHITAAGLDLCGLSAGGPLGSNYITQLYSDDAACKRAGKPAIDVVRFASASEGVVALQTGKLDAYLEDAPPSHVYLGRAQGELQPGGRTSQDPTPMGIAVAKSNPQLRAAIRKAVNALYTNGTIPGIFTSWGVPELSLR